MCFPCTYDYNNIRILSLNITIVPLIYFIFIFYYNENGNNIVNTVSMRKILHGGGGRIKKI